jgi:hypothetical protein
MDTLLPSVSGRVPLMDFLVGYNPWEIVSAEDDASCVSSTTGDIAGWLAWFLWY